MDMVLKKFEVDKLANNISSMSEFPPEKKFGRMFDSIAPENQRENFWMCYKRE